MCTASVACRRLSSAQLSSSAQPQQLISSAHSAHQLSSAHPSPSIHHCTYLLYLSLSVLSLLQFMHAQGECFLIRRNCNCNCTCFTLPAYHVSCMPNLSYTPYVRGACVAGASITGSSSNQWSRTKPSNRYLISEARFCICRTNYLPSSLHDGLHSLPCVDVDGS
jgi:hypothetical protein